MSTANQAVFLSYASQDAEAAHHLAESMRAAGVDVWFDAEGGLEHGDDWDAKIRRQIKECVLFIPLISANTQARHEGYFRIEWELAAQRAMGIASGVPFILPVVIDDTREPDALVPDRFRMVQWTKLPGGAVPSDVQARFLKLWAQRTGTASAETMHAPAGPVRAERPTATSGRRPRWLVAALIGVAAAIALTIARPWARSDSAHPTSAPSSEVRQLVAKAWAKLNQPGLARAELDNADTLCQRAVALDPTDADAWAAASQVNTWYVYQNLDDSPQRRQAAQDDFSRALQLAPESFEARLAEACYWVRGHGGELGTSLHDVDADKLLHDLLRERPDEPRARHALGILQRNLGQWDDASASFERLALNPAFAAIAWGEKGWSQYFHGDFRSAVDAVDRSLAIEPCAGSLGLKVELALGWQGDLALALATVNRMPASDLREDWGIALVMMVSRWRRDPQTTLRTLDGVPRDWLQSNEYDGPTALARGEARLQAGQVEAARRDLRRALDLIDERLAKDPNNVVLLSIKAETLFNLEDHAAAEATYRLLKEITGRPPRLFLQVMFEPQAAVVRLESQMDQPPEDWADTAAGLRLNPRYDPLRRDPRFAAIVARAEADPRRSPTASVESRTFSAPADDQKSVAVLAFANLSDDKDNEYFSDGISEELLNVLAKVPGLKVTARTSAFFFKGKQVPIADIAQQLGVAYVVEGSVRKAGDRVRISAQLIKASDGFQVWSDSFDRELKDIFAVQDEIAGLIASNLSLRMGVNSSASETINPAAFQLYLEGRQAWRLRTEAGFEQAERLFNQALAIDPKFARAYVGLADVWLIRSLQERMLGAFDQRESPTYAKSEAAAQKALDLNPDLAEAHATLGLVHNMDWRFEDSIRELHRAVSLNPSYTSGHQWLGRVYLSNGQMDEALEQLKLAHELDPLYARVADNYGQALISAQRPQEALAALDQALAVQPDSNQALRMKAVALAELGRPEEAITASRLYLARGADIGIDLVAYALARAGARTEAAKIITDVDRLGPNPPWLAASLALGGADIFDHDIAVGGIDAQTLDLLYYWPIFDPVRDKPGFVQMLQTLGLTEAHARAQKWRAAHPPEKAEAKP